MWDIDFRNHPLSDGDIDSFSVCVMAREEGAVLQRFVDHYTRAGASRIFLYFDGTQDEAQAACQEFANNDLVTLQVCDKEFWGEMFPDQEKVLLDPKLICVFRRSIELNDSDWILFCDADEFVVGRAPLGEVLAQVPSEIHGVRLLNTEAVWGQSDDVHEPFGCTYERRRFPPKKVIRRAILPFLTYGMDGFVLKRGLAGHVQGKHLIRKGVVPERMSSHSSTADGQRASLLWKTVQNTRGLRIVHFDAIGFERWREKWLSRIEGRTISDKMARVRLRQMARVEKAIKNGTDEQLFRRYYGLNRWQKFVLRRFGLLTRIGK